jgi:mRNA interferase RelE/StbE
VHYTVLLHPKAAKTLQKLKEPAKTRIKQKLRELKENPEAGKPLKYSPFWSLRISDYRAIYEINKNQKQIIIPYIGHRKDIYTDFTKLL